MENMENLIEELVTSHISDHVDVSSIHPRYSQYKVKGLVSTQEKRRNEWLLHQKEKRAHLLNLQRGLLSSDDDDMDVEVTDKKYKKYSNFNEYKGYLMLSEWLVAVPNDIDKNWLCKICPEGRRALVIAGKGKTSAYGRNGYCFFISFPSWLPGGSKLNCKGTTILDTIFDQSSSTFYILDIIQWSIETTGFEAEMRFYWLATKIKEETPQINECCTTNKYKFEVLEYFTYSELAKKIKVHPIFPGNSPKVDGILFFHREGYYVHTRSPLVTWLKPFMLTDILGIHVPAEYQKEKPSNYSEMETGDASHRA